MTEKDRRFGRRIALLAYGAFGRHVGLDNVGILMEAELTVLAKIHANGIGFLRQEKNP